MQHLHQRRPRHKPRLYIGYYTRPSCPMQPHQTLLAGPEYLGKRAARSTYTKFRIVQTPKVSDADADPAWTYECAEIKDIQSEQRLVALVCLGKILISDEEMKSLLAQVPIRQTCDPDQERARQFKDTAWVASAFNLLSNKGHISYAATLASSEDLECRSQAFIQAYGGWGPGPCGKDIPVLDLMYSKAKNECAEYY